VIDFYLGRRSMNDMRAAATKTHEKCMATFYLAEWRLLHGDTEQARQALQMAADECSKSSSEYSGARAELKRLER